MDYLYNENVKRILELLNELKASRNFKNKMLNMKSEFEQYTSNIVRTRVKSPFSMARKFYEIGCRRVMDMKDLYGFMVVVEDYDDVDKVSEYIKESYGSIIRREKDYRKINPENGYKSYHFNLGIQDEEISDEILIEIQIKTRSMFIAQEATHDEIYKDKSIGFKERKELVAALFPLVERLAYLYEQRKQNVNNEKEKLIIDEIKKIYDRNKEIYNNNPKAISLVWKEYAIANFMQNNERAIMTDDFLHLGVNNSKLTKIELRRVLNYFLDTYTEDDAIKMMMNLPYTDFRKVLEKIEGQYLLNEGTITGVWETLEIENEKLIEKIKRNVKTLTAGVYSDDLVQRVYGINPRMNLQERIQNISSVNEIDYIGAVEALDLTCENIQVNVGNTDEFISKGNEKDNKDNTINSEMEIII